MKLHNRMAMTFRNMERARVHHGGRRWLRRQANRLLRQDGRRIAASWPILVLENELAEAEAQQARDLFEENEYA